MNSAALQVEKLEALLARVQANRGAARPAPSSGASAREESFEDPPSLVPEPSFFTPQPAKSPAPPQPAAAPVPRPPVRSSTEPIAPSATASRPARTPLELAVETKLERPSTHPNQASAGPVVPPPVSFQRSSSDEAVVLADPAPPTASRSIGQVVSKSAPIVAQTFGDLLRRSLSLRPR
jgi:hypothetical protein